MNANFDAITPREALHCLVCEKVIPEGAWFARVKCGDGRVAFCRPKCVEKFVSDEDVYTRKAADTASISVMGN